MAPFTRRELVGKMPIPLSGVIAGCITRSGTTPGNNTSPATVSSSTSASTSSTSVTRTSPPISDGTAAPAPSCPDGFSPVEPFWTVYGTGPLAGFRLELYSRNIALGETLTCELRNITNSENGSGNRRKYDVQYEAESGWHTIFGTKRDGVYRTDELVKHEPGSGFRWEFPFTRDGLSDVVEDDGYYACGPIDTGRYRFVYWGLTSDREAEENFETDYALGVPFTVTDG